MFLQQITTSPSYRNQGLASPRRTGSSDNRSIEKLRELTERLEKTERFFEAFLNQCPFVMWCKDYSDGSGRMLFISDLYSEIFCVTPEKYVGKTDYDVWPTHIADTFRKQDLEVIRSGVEVWRAEPTPLADKPQWKHCMTLKFPIKTPDGEVIGVGGIAWPSNAEVQRTHV